MVMQDNVEANMGLSKLCLDERSWEDPSKIELGVQSSFGPMLVLSSSISVGWYKHAIEEGTAL